MAAKSASQLLLRDRASGNCFECPKRPVWGYVPRGADDRTGFNAEDLEDVGESTQDALREALAGKRRVAVLDNNDGQTFWTTGLFEGGVSK